MRDMSPTLKEPQITPSDHCYLILQDYGIDGGGWGPSAIEIEGIGMIGPAVYTGNDATTIMAFCHLVEELYIKTGRETKLVKYTGYEEIKSAGGENG